MESLGFIWKFRQLLQNEEITVYRLAQELHPNVSKVTLYRWNTHTPESVNIGIIVEVLEGLKKITGRDYQLSDLIEYSTSKKIV